MPYLHLDSKLPFLFIFVKFDKTKALFLHLFRIAARLGCFQYFKIAFKFGFFMQYIYIYRIHYLNTLKYHDFVLLEKKVFKTISVNILTKFLTLHAL